MNTRKTLALIGGDMRQSYVGEFFNNIGFDVYNYSNASKYNNCHSLSDLMNKCDIIVLPIPSLNENQYINLGNGNSIDFSSIATLLDSKRHVVFGACFPSTIVDYFITNNIRYYDILSNNKVAWYNSIATAEGIIMTAISEGNINIANSNCLVTGFGKCGQIISKKLAALDANVTVAARNSEQRAIAKTFGYFSIPIENIDQFGHNFNFVFNTVPSPVINKTIIESLNSECIILDIASYPGGTDFKYAREKNIKALLRLSIPGKISPKSSGIIISEYINSIISDNN